MAVTDPADARLLAALADVGKVAVHELAATVGMDPRDVAYRLVNLSATGLPLLVGVESDPNGLRAALAASATTPPTPGPAPSAPPHTGPYPVRGTPSGPYPVPGGPYVVHGTPSGAHPVHGSPSGPYPSPPTPQPYPPQHPGAPRPGPQPERHQPPGPPPASTAADGMSTWGPPQSALWARGDQLPARPAPDTTTAAVRTGGVGAVLETEGLEGEQLAVQLLEVQDPADSLFAAAGYRLDDGERAVVVHTEITNRGSVPFASLPDNYLELLTADGTPIAKAPVSLTSRPPHRIGVRPGETGGGHTVYVVSEATRITAVRWSPRPEPDDRSLTWTIDD